VIVDEKYLGVFKYEKFNPMQSIVAEQLLNSNENVVIAAPTGIISCFI
jgi:replicative superfamily II helicase